MRPDKKKKDYNKGKKPAEKTPEVPPQPLPKVDPKPDPEPGQGEIETPKPAETKSGKRVKVVEEKPPNNISSNWTKFEIPSDEENEAESSMTGLSFEYALENAGT